MMPRSLGVGRTVPHLREASNRAAIALRSASAAHFFSLAHLALAMIVVAWLGSGIGSVLLGAVPGSIKWIIATIWLLAACLDPRFLRSFLSRVWPLLIFLGVIFMAVAPGDEVGRAYVQNIAYLIPIYALYEYYSCPARSRSRFVLLILMLADIAIVAIRTAWFLREHPGISRLLATGNVYRDVVATLGATWWVGGYVHAYSLPLVLLIFLYQALVGRRLRVLSWVLVGLGTILLVQMAFTIALLLWFLLAVYVTARLKMARKTVFALLPLAIVALPFIVVLSAVLLPAVAAFPNLPPEVSTRLLEVMSFLSGDHSPDSDLSMRLELYSISLAHFSENVFTGGVLQGMEMGSTGEHSTWLDTLAAFGLISIGFFAFLIGAFRTQVERGQSTAKVIVRCAWGYIVVVGIVNPVLFAHLALVWLILVPFGVQMIVAFNGGTREGAVDHERPDS